MFVRHKWWQWTNWHATQSCKSQFCSSLRIITIHILWQSSTYGDNIVDWFCSLQFPRCDDFFRQIPDLTGKSWNIFIILVNEKRLVSLPQQDLWERISQLGRRWVPMVCRRNSRRKKYNQTNAVSWTPFISLLTNK